MITIFQVVALIFALFALSRVFLRLRDGNLTRREFVFWTAVWVVIIVLAFLPNLSTSVARYVGIESGVNLLMSLSIILIFYLIFRLYIKIENTNQEITRIVRELALDKKRKK